MEEISKERLIEAVNEMKTKTGAAALLGINYKILVSLIEKFGCNDEVDVLLNQRKRKKHVKFSLNDLDMVLNGEKLLSAYKLKIRLFQFGLKKEVCERCGCTEWLGKKIPLELHHKNGNNLDNNIDNLEILCPNCHALEPNYRGSNKISHKNKVLKIEKIKNIQDTFDSGVNDKKEKNDIRQTKTEKRFCIICGKVLHSRNKICCSKECFDIWNTRNIPSKN